jgi:hypothetical protein
VCVFFSPNILKMKWRAVKSVCMRKILLGTVVNAGHEQLFLLLNCLR